MISLKKVLLFAFVLLAYQHISLQGMEVPKKINQHDRELLSKFIENYRNPDFIFSRKDVDLEHVIPVAQYVIDNPQEFDNFWKIIKKGFPDLKNKENSAQIFNDVITKATQELKKRKPKVKQKVCAAPKLQKNIAAPKKITPVELITLKKIIQAEINGEIDYIKTRSNHALESAIELANIILNSHEEFTTVKKELGLPTEQLRSVLERVKQKASIALRLAQNKAQIHLQEKKEVIPEKIAAPAQIVPAVIKPEEPEEEEVQANQLYIGLDVKELNSNGQPIRWQDSIDAMQAQIKDAEFMPNDYFHITIAWYEAKNQLTPEIIARVERALTNASQILKIVFPNGVRGVALRDSAVLLGNKSATVAFRVAESADLKKLQDILLKFLSFENLADFKYNTFEKDTPIHVTLGKIRSKSGRQYQNAAANLHAPEGARASQGQSFTINTFRLTYSLAGQAWQEKMSYKF